MVGLNTLAVCIAICSYIRIASAAGVDGDGHHVTIRLRKLQLFGHLQNVGRPTAEVIGVRDGGRWTDDQDDLYGDGLTTF